MGGAQFFWRVTLLKGIGRDDIFRLEEHSIPLGEPRPNEIPYREISPKLTYAELTAKLPYIGNDVGQVFASSSAIRQAEFYYARHMSI